jgi:hypothetical protein
MAVSCPVRSRGVTHLFAAAALQRPWQNRDRTLFVSDRHDEIRGRVDAIVVLLFLACGL